MEAVHVTGAMLAGTLGVWKTVSASPNSRNLSALVAHPNAPLLATGTASQVGFPQCSVSSATQLFTAGKSEHCAGSGASTGTMCMMRSGAQAGHWNELFPCESACTEGVCTCAGSEAVERSRGAAGCHQSYDVSVRLPAAWSGQHTGLPPLPAVPRIWGRGYHSQPVQHKDWHCARQGYVGALALRPGV